MSWRAGRPNGGRSANATGKNRLLRLLVVLAVVTITATVLWRAGRAPEHVQPSKVQNSWIIFAGAIRKIDRSTNDPSLTRELFDNNSTYLVSSTQTGSFSSAIRTLSYASVSQLPTEGVFEPVRAILYDPEGWSLTPPEERRFPGIALKTAHSYAVLHHLDLIFTPAPNLLGRGARSSVQRLNALLASGLYRRAAKYADVVVIQAQAVERNPKVYAAAVRAAAAQIRVANATTRVFADLSTQPQGHSVPVSTLQAAYDLTKGIVDGYWLNVPGHGPACPTCRTGDPRTAAAFLRWLASS